MLPGYIPLPTLWREEERVMLVGSSLEVRFYDFVYKSQEKTFK
jgi:hypothetical protein